MPEYSLNPDDLTKSLLRNTDSNQWSMRQRPIQLPKGVLRTNSATGTTNSSYSDLRTPHTPVRFADPLAHYADFKNHHPSVYLREQNSTNTNEHPQKSRYYSEFNVGQRNSVKQVDYRLPDRDRPLEVRVENRSLYIDPKTAKEVSPQIASYLLREYAAGHKSSVEPKIEDLKYDEVLQAIRSVCPTDLGLFATPVNAATFSSLARISRTFQVEKLKQSCELYVARLPMKLDELNAAFASHLLNDAFKYGLNSKSRIRLLQGVVGLIEAELKDPTRLPTYSSKNSNMLPVICRLIDAALDEYKNGRLGHDKMLNEARLKIPCRNCRVEEPQFSVQPALYDLQVCSRCRQTTCRKCVKTPCATLVEEFMNKFAQEYAKVYEK